MDALYHRLHTFQFEKLGHFAREPHFTKISDKLKMDYPTRWNNCSTLGCRNRNDSETIFPGP